MQDSWLISARRGGLFNIARASTRRALRILCYHGFATGDLLQFRPGLFISPGTFERRLEFLAKYRYPVLSLEAALSALDRGDLPDAATVITVDDVFQGFVTHALPLLQAYGIPATTYVTTYYCVARRPVFRLVVRYMFWKTRAQHVAIELGEPAPLVFRRATAGEWRDGEERTIAFGEALGSEEERSRLLDRLGQLLDVDYETIARGRELNVVTPEGVEALSREGIDVQLHTHRHRLPERRDVVEREIVDNRRVLEPLVGRPLAHFCYPSGIWSRAHWPWLEACGITSATTCDPGLNRKETPRLGLKRFLDSEELSQIRFEAEMSGFKHVVRRVLSPKRS